MNKFAVFFKNKRKNWIAIVHAKDEDAAQRRVVHNYPESKIIKIEPHRYT